MGRNPDLEEIQSRLVLHETQDGILFSVFWQTFEGLSHSRPAIRFIFRKKNLAIEILYLDDYLELEGKQSI